MLSVGFPWKDVGLWWTSGSSKPGLVVSACHLGIARSLPVTFRHRARQKRCHKLQECDWLRVKMFEWFQGKSQFRLSYSHALDPLIRETTRLLQCWRVLAGDGRGMASMASMASMATEFWGNWMIIDDRCHFRKSMQNLLVSTGKDVYIFAHDSALSRCRFSIHMQLRWNCSVKLIPASPKPWKSRWKTGFFLRNWVAVTCCDMLWQNRSNCNRIVSPKGSVWSGSALFPFILSYFVKTVLASTGRMQKVIPRTEYLLTQGQECRQAVLLCKGTVNIVANGVQAYMSWFNLWRTWPCMIFIC